MLVQTTAPDAAAIVAAARHDADGLPRAASSSRRAALRYPPFADLIRVVASATETGPARAAADAVAAAVRAGTGEATELLGPAPLFRLRGRERFQVVLKTHERAPRDRRDRRAPSRPPPATARHRASRSRSTSTRSNLRRAGWPSSTRRRSPAATRRWPTLLRYGDPALRSVARARSSASTARSRTRCGAWPG